MSRALRRQAERDQRRGITHTPKVLPLPPLFDEFTVFDFPQIMLDKLINGEIEAVQGVPVFYDNHGVLTEICPALEGWIFTWHHINEKLNGHLNLSPLERINNKMRLASPITPNELMQARLCLDNMRKFFRAADRKAICEISKTAQIAILMEGVSHAN